MGYPIWGESFLIGKAGLTAVAILLAFVAHATAGVGFINAVLLRRAAQTSNPLMIRFIPHAASMGLFVPTIATQVLVLITWIYATLVMPAATSTIVHLFMWPLIIQALAFIVQALAAYALYRPPSTFPIKRATVISWIYAISAGISVALISLITSFMLTPGSWIATFDFVDAMFNPTFIPSLILHAAWAVILGGIILMLIANVLPGYTDDERHDLERAAGRWLWISVIVIPLAPLYLMALGSMYSPSATSPTTASLLLIAGIALTLVVLLHVFIAQVIRPYRIGLVSALTLTITLLFATTSFDLAQARLRAPYTISGYIYSNGMMVAAAPRINREGLLSQDNWVIPRGLDLARIPSWKRGEWVFRALRYEWYMGKDARWIRTRMATADLSAIKAYLENLSAFAPNIPPFAGTPQELDDLAAFLHRTSEGDMR